MASIEIRGMEELLADLQKIEHKAGDLTQVWPLIGRLWKQREQDVFSSNGRGRWAPLAAETIRRKAQLGQPRTALIAHRSLSGDLTVATPRFSTPTSAIYGPPKGAESTRYGKWHVKGTSNMPARNPVPKLSANERRQMVSVIRKWLMEGV